MLDPKNRIGYDEDETICFFVGVALSLEASILSPILPDPGPQEEPKDYLYRRFRADKRIHWCFLGQRVPGSVGGMPWLRHANSEKLPMDIVTGDADWEDNRRSLLPQILPKLKEGYTVAVMYAQRTYNLNLGVERMEMVKVSHSKPPVYGPSTCSTADLSIWTPRSLRSRRQTMISEDCLVCGKAPSKNVCSGCKMGPYCSQVCQVEHRKPAHRRECPVLMQLRDWREMDWSTYDHDRLPL